MSVYTQRQKVWSWSVVLILLLGNCIEVDAKAKSEDASGTKEEKELIDWVREKGGIVNVTVGKACPTCLRGLLAPNDIPPAGLIIRLPSQTLVKLADLDHTGFAAVRKPCMHCMPNGRVFWGPITPWSWPMLTAGVPSDKAALLFIFEMML